MSASPEKQVKSWNSSVIEFVRSTQEDAYRNLAVELGLGADPTQAFRHLNVGLPPARAISPLKTGLGSQSGLTREDWVKFDQLVTVKYEHYAALSTPTLFERQATYLIMAMMFDGVQEGFAKDFTPPPFLATLPSGDVNARIVFEPDTQVPVMFFEQGLFQYLSDMASLIAWEAPAFSLAQLNDDHTLVQNAVHRHTMPFDASGYWAGALQAYVASGSPVLTPSPIPRPAHSVFLAMSLLTEMEWFVMAHELAHIELGHVNRTPRSRDEAWELEYEADARAFLVLSQLAERHGTSWGVCLWSCLLALTCLGILDRAIETMAFGTYDVYWVSATHPDPFARQQRLRNNATSLSPPTLYGQKAAEELLGMTDVLLPKGFEFASIPLFLSYQHGQRPSPLWKERIARSFKPK